MSRPRQQAIRAVYVRGGTSRALLFHGGDLPAPSGGDRSAWDAIFAAALGSPDPAARQLDGLGGGISSLSKVAVVTASSRLDADVDYTFGQVSVTAVGVSYRGNCGNISSAVGPFAVDEGLVPAPADGATTVRIFNTNTSKLIHATFSTTAGKADVTGDFAIQGVAGTGAPIRLAFLDPGGATTGKLLPTGKPVDRLYITGIGPIEVSMVDAANPVVFVMADTIGTEGGMAPEAIGGNAPLMALLEEIRVAAALRMGIAASESDAREHVTNLPLVAILAAPASESEDIRVRTISAGQPHKAIPLTGAMCLAVAAKIEGSLAQQTLRTAAAGDLRIAHASGILPVDADVADGRVRSVVVYRTSRRLMEGNVLIPGRTGFSST